MMLKTFYIDVDDTNETGLNFVSFVDEPAIEVNWLKFSEDDKEKMSFKLDEDQHIVFGPAIVADKEIYRNKNGFEFFVVFTKNAIKKMVEKYSKDGKLNSVDVNHNENAVDDVVMIESFIKDEANGISPKEFEDVTDGSWFTKFKVNNEELWQKVKSGEVKGFSVAGMFDLKDEEFKEEHEQTIPKNADCLTIEVIYDGEEYVSTDQNIKFNGFDNIYIMKKNLLTLAKMIMQLSQTQTDKGVLVAEAELAEGVEVFVEDENGELIPAVDGEYITEDKVIVVAEGKVSEIKDKEEEKPAEPAAEEPKPEEMATEPTEPAEPAEPAEPEPDEKDKLIADLNGQIVGKDIEIENLNAKIAELVAQLDEANKKAEEFAAQVPAFKENKDDVTPVKSIAEVIRDRQ